MRAPASLRPEIASVYRFVSPKPAARFVHPPLSKGAGILAELASGRGLR